MRPWGSFGEFSLDQNDFVRSRRSGDGVIVVRQVERGPKILRHRARPPLRRPSVWSARGSFYQRISLTQGRVRKPPEIEAKDGKCPKDGGKE